MTPILALFGATFRSALPLKRTIFFAILELTPAFLFVLASNNRTEEAAYETLIEVATGTLFILVLPIVTIVLASSALGAERRDQTLSFIVLRPMRRTMIASIKIAATISAAFLLNAIGVAALAGSYALQYSADGDVVFGLMVGTAIAVAAYAAVLVPLGFITDRAVIIGLAFLLVFENGIAFALPGLASLSPWRLGATAVGGIVERAQPILREFLGSETITLSASRSMSTVVIYVLASATFTALLLKRRDLA
jgi:ABC-2 type transport system permease protein